MTQQEAPAQAPRRRRAWRTVTGTVMVLLLTVLGCVGGLAATSLWPTTVQTEYYSAQVRLSPSPAYLSTVHNPTVVGDIDVRFDGALPAPGVESRIAVKETITELFTRGEVDVSSIAPDPDELREAVGDGLRELAWKFGGGVLVAQVLVVLIWAQGRGRWSAPKATACLLAGAVLATAPAGVAALLTYRPGNVAEFTTSGLLGQVYDRPDMFQAIDQQARMGGQYVQNLLVLSATLQEEFGPLEANAPTGARFLLVSDVHGMNFYPLMRQIVVEQDIDAVIDTGDLVNFGRPEEGKLGRLYRGIESLGVPYVFVRGNHDATSRADESVLRRLAEVPNVVLLEPTAGRFVEAEVNGVRISGFNDWRYFAESNEDPLELQREAAAAYALAVQGHPAPDIAIGHEPFGMDLVATQGVTVNGHMHVAALDGHRIQVGSFTGGGLVNHFRVERPADDETFGELVGAPYAFDVLTFDRTCSVQSLTRFTYRDLVSGRPEYNEVSIVNGRQLAPPVADRSCGPDQELRVTPISPVNSVDSIDPVDPVDPEGQG